MKGRLLWYEEFVKKMRSSDIIAAVITNAPIQPCVVRNTRTVQTSPTIPLRSMISDGHWKPTQPGPGRFVGEYKNTQDKHNYPSYMHRESKQKRHVPYDRKTVCSCHREKKLKASLQIHGGALKFEEATRIFTQKITAPSRKGAVRISRH